MCDDASAASDVAGRRSTPFKLNYERALHVIGEKVMELAAARARIPEDEG